MHARAATAVRPAQLTGARRMSLPGVLAIDGIRSKITDGFSAMALALLVRVCRSLNDIMRPMILELARNRDGASFLNMRQDVVRVKMTVLDLTTSFATLKYMKMVEGFKPLISYEPVFDCPDNMSGRLLKCVLQEKTMKNSNVEACIRFGQKIDKNSMISIYNECDWKTILLAEDRMGWERSNTPTMRVFKARAAARLGNIEALEAIFEEDGAGSLKEACRGGAEGALKASLEWLVAKGFKLVPGNVGDCTWACIAGRRWSRPEEDIIETIKFIIGASRKNIKVYTKSLLDVIRGGRVKVAKYLLADVVSPSTISNETFKESLSYAAISGNTEMVKLVAELQLRQDFDPASISHYAIRHIISDFPSDYVKFVLATLPISQDQWETAIDHIVGHLSIMKHHGLYSASKDYKLLDKVIAQSEQCVFLREVSMISAARRNNVALMTYLHRNGCQITTGAVFAAAERCNRDAIDFAIHNGFKITDAVLQAAGLPEYATTFQRQSFIDWLMTASGRQE